MLSPEIASTEVRAHLEIATIGVQLPEGSDREPSWARSGQEAERTFKSSPGRPSIRTRCEPRTARGPVVASRCTQVQSSRFFLLFLGLWTLGAGLWTSAAAQRTNIADRFD